MWRAAVDDSKHAGEHQGPAWIRDWLHHGDDHCWDNDVCGDFYNDDDDNDTLTKRNIDDFQDARMVLDMFTIVYDHHHNQFRWMNTFR